MIVDFRALRVSFTARKSARQGCKTTPPIQATPAGDLYRHVLIARTDGTFGSTWRIRNEFRFCPIVARAC